MSSAPALDPVLTALPPPCQTRLLVMGWPSLHGSDPDRALRRAIGAAQHVSLVDLELYPERWHGAYVATSGTVGWSRDTMCLGRLWLSPGLTAQVDGKPRAYPGVFQARVTGILLADPKVRAAHHDKHHCLGGYGRFGLFIAELYAASIHVEVQAASSRSSAGAAASRSSPAGRASSPSSSARTAAARR